MNISKIKFMQMNEKKNKLKCEKYLYIHIINNLSVYSQLIHLS